MIITAIKKPVEITAIVWDGSDRSTKECLKFMGDFASKTFDVRYFSDYCSLVREKGLPVYTLEDGFDGQSKHTASIGDYIIKGIKGEFYPCKPDIFKMTYDIVGDEL